MNFESVVMAIKKNAIVILLACLVAISVVAVGYLIVQNDRLRNDPKTLQDAQAKKDDQLLATIGKIYSLPTGEKPVLGTVDDKEKLKDQPFFKDARNGDRLVIYAKAKKAIIYRESENKIINAGPIAITTDTAAQKQSESQPAKTETQTQTRTTR